MKSALPFLGIAALLAYFMVRDMQAKQAVANINADNYSRNGRFVPYYTGSDISGGPSYG